MADQLLLKSSMKWSLVSGVVKKTAKKGRKVQIFENERVPWGQDVTLQSSRSKIWPSQTFPPFCGMGLLHSRSRFLTLKSPQVALHSDQCPQELQPPSMSLNAYKIKKKNHLHIFCTWVSGGNFNDYRVYIELNFGINRQS